MRIPAALLVCVAPLLAQDTDDTIKKAQELERRAERLLDEGRRAAAFELLARAADLRAKARGETKTAKKAKAQPKAKATDRPTDRMTDRPTDRMAEKKKPAGHKAAVNQAMDAMDRALETGDMQGAARAARQVRRRLAAWAKALEAREKRAAKPRKPDGLDARLASLEKQVRELKRLLDAAGG